MSDNNIVRLNSHRKAHKDFSYAVFPEFQLRVEGIREYLVRASEAMVDKFFSEMANGIAEAKVADCTEEMSDLLSRKEDISAAYLQSLLKEFDCYWSDEACNAIDLTPILEPNFEQLSEEELDEMTMLASLYERSASDYEECLTALTKRFETIKHSHDNQEMDNPLSPQIFTALFRRSLNLNPKGWDTKLRMICYQYFNRAVLAYLGGIYDDLNAMWERSGVVSFAGGSAHNANILTALPNADINQVNDSKSDTTIQQTPLLALFIAEIEADHFILEDVKELVSQLYPALINLEQIAPGFIANLAHPATELLNVMCEIGLSLNDEHSEAASALLVQVHSSIELIVAAKNADERIFEQVNAHIAEQWQAFTHQANQNEVQVVSARTAQEKLHFARKNVKSLLESIIETNSHVPELTALLREGWHDVLLLTLIREGEESKQWHSEIKVLNDLVWSVQHKVNKAERTQLLQRIPSLIEQLREGLMAISFEQQRSKELLKGIQQVHIRVIGGQLATRDTYLRANEYAEEDTLPYGELWHQDDSLLLPLHAKGLVCGQWISWQKKNKLIKAKIAWQSDSVGSSLLINSCGQRVTEVAQADLLQGFLNKHIQLLKPQNYCSSLVFRSVEEETFEVC